jgi:hypothetical protein
MKSDGERENLARTCVHSEIICRMDARILEARLEISLAEGYQAPLLEKKLPAVSTIAEASTLCFL